MKNIFQKIKRYRIILYICAFALTPGYILPVGEPGMQLSEEDAKFLEEAQKTVESYVSNLPTEATLRAQGLSEEQIKKTDTKESFEREVKRLSSMSEEDLLKEIEKAIADVNAAPTPQAQPELPKTNVRQNEDEKKPESKQVIPTNKQQAALQLIETTIMSISNFLRKAQIMAELPGKIPAWIKEGKLRGWPTNLQWNTFKGQVEELEAKITKLKDRDLRTGVYKYLDDFIKDEGLYNNITKVKDSLTRNEPKIELSSFGIDKMTSDSRLAVRSVLLSLYEAVNALSIPSHLDRIFEKYEPTAKKIKESEEANQRKALEESRKQRTPGGLSYAGQPSYAKDRAVTKYDSDGGRYTGTPYDNISGQDRSRDALSKGTGAPAATAGGAPGKGNEPKKDDGAGKQPEKPKRETDKRAEGYENAFMTAIETFRDRLEENNNFKQIEKYITKDKDSFGEEDITELVANIKDATKAINKATGETNKLKSHLGNLNDVQKKEYRKAFKDFYNQAKTSFEGIVTQINNLLKPTRSSITSSFTQPQIRIFRTKFYSVLGKEYEKELQDEVDRQKKANAGAPLTGNIKTIDSILNKLSPANLNDLKTKIQGLQKAVSEL